MIQLEALKAQLALLGHTLPDDQIMAILGEMRIDVADASGERRCSCLTSCVCASGVSKAATSCTMQQPPCMQHAWSHLLPTCMLVNAMPPAATNGAISVLCGPPQDPAALPCNSHPATVRSPLATQPMLMRTPPPPPTALAAHTAQALGLRHQRRMAHLQHSTLVAMGTQTLGTHLRARLLELLLERAGWQLCSRKMTTAS
jgi:hypothetical protein